MGGGVDATARGDKISIVIEQLNKCTAFDAGFFANEQDGLYALKNGQLSPAHARMDSTVVERPLKDRVVEAITSKKAINIALCLIGTACSIAVMFFVPPAFIATAIKVAMILIGLASCVNNNLRSDPFVIDRRPSYRIITKAGAQEQELTRAMFAHFMKVTQPNY